jgi:phage-related protein
MSISLIKQKGYDLSTVLEYKKEKENIPWKENT